MTDTDYEIADDTNFDPDRYLAGNLDLQPLVAGGGNLRAHFDTFGRSEARRQLTVTAMADMVARRERYSRFAPLFDAAAGGNEAFSCAREPGTVPVLYGMTQYDLAQYDSESANAGFGPFVNEVRTNPTKLYADIGCGRRAEKADNCLYVEVYPSVSADLVMVPGSRYPIADASLDGIGCFAVLEHVEEPWKVAAEFRRMLKPGGRLFIDWPFLQPVHGYPSHYYNATRAGLRRMFEDGFAIEVVDTFPNQTAAHTLHWCLSALLGELGERDPAQAQRLAGMTVGQLAAEVPTGDVWRAAVEALSPQMQMTLACGNSLIATRSIPSDAVPGPNTGFSRVQAEAESVTIAS